MKPRKHFNIDRSNIDDIAFELFNLSPENIKESHKSMINEYTDNLLQAWYKFNQPAALHTQDDEKHLILVKEAVDKIISSLKANARVRILECN